MVIQISIGVDWFMFQFINFTMEQEQDDKLAFLDVLVM